MKREREDSESPLALFKRFQEKFRECELVPHARGLARGHSDYGQPGEYFNLDAGRLYLAVHQSVPDGAVRQEAIRFMKDAPYVNLVEANVSFSVQFDSSQGMRAPFMEGLWQALQDGPMKGFKVFMDPVFDPNVDPGEVFTWNDQGVRPSGPLEISFTANVMSPWLHNLIGKPWCFVESWRQFIPPGPERAAIEMAIDLEKAKKRTSTQRGEEEGIRAQLRSLIAEQVPA